MRSHEMLNNIHFHPEWTVSSSYINFDMIPTIGAKGLRRLCFVVTPRAHVIENYFRTQCMGTQLRDRFFLCFYKGKFAS